ncbi:MAG: hypothetical protein JW723_12795 [Bacteroidales bacterium]|nr:hypothetical protein [Bacteroidales bacterium]
MVFLTIAFLLSSCEDTGYKIEYQEGYPNRLAGNWIAVDYQLTKENYLVAIDTINDFDLTSDTKFYEFAELLEITGESDPYDLVSALDPYFQNSIIFNNIYDSGIRIRVDYNDRFFEGRLKDQLEMINYGGYNINFVSVSGQMVEDTQGDLIFMVVGLYDKEKTLLESLIIQAYRKTGFEDTEYRSLLNN